MLTEFNKYGSPTVDRKFLTDETADGGRGEFILRGGVKYAVMSLRYDWSQKRGTTVGLAQRHYTKYESLNYLTEARFFFRQEHLFQRTTRPIIYLTIS